MPPELWAQVGTHVDSVQDLVALCSVCHALRWISDLLLGSWLQAQVPELQTQTVHPRALGFLCARIDGKFPQYHIAGGADRC